MFLQEDKQIKLLKKFLQLCKSFMNNTADGKSNYSNMSGGTTRIDLLINKILQLA